MESAAHCLDDCEVSGLQKRAQPGKYNAEFCGDMRATFARVASMDEKGDATK